MELVFVTNNPGKLREINNILGDNFRLLSLADIGFEGEIPEIYPTLEENASAKAYYIYDRFLKDCFADDTGLEVEAINNRPGVYSARFAGKDEAGGITSVEEQTEANIDKLLRMLKGKKSRKARFRTVISLIKGAKELRFEGTVNGDIITERRGSGGFGYDPVFIPDGSKLTFAEMDLAEKNRISHRARAFKKLVDYLRGTPDRM